MFSIRTGASNISDVLLVILHLPQQGLLINRPVVQLPLISPGVVLVISITSHFPRGGARYAEMDERPYCKKCFEKVPVELRRRLKKQAD